MFAVHEGSLCLQYMNSSAGSLAGFFLHERHKHNDFPKLLGWWGHDMSTRFIMDNSKFSSGWWGMAYIYLYISIYIYIDFTTALCKSKYSKYTCVCVYFSVLNDYKTPAERLDDKLNQMKITSQFRVVGAQHVHQGCHGQ